MPVSFPSLSLSLTPRRPERVVSLPRSKHIKQLTSIGFAPSLESVLSMANPPSGGVTASTEMLAAKRHAGVHTPAIVGKMIIANQPMAYAA